MAQYTDPVTREVVTIPDTWPLAERQRALQDLLKIPGTPRPPEFVQGSMEAQLGAPLERGEAGGVMEFNQPGTRFDLERSNKLSEKMAKLKAGYPDMEVRQITDPKSDEPMIAVRVPGEKGFRLLDSEDFFTFSDIAEVGGMLANAETLGTIVAAIRSRGASLGKRVLDQFIGGAGGRAVDIGIEGARGFEHDPFTSLVGQATQSGALAAVGEVAASAVTGTNAGGRLKRALGGFKLTPEDVVANRFSVEATGEPLPIGAVAPLAETIENQAAIMNKQTATWRRQYLSKIIENMKDHRALLGGLEGMDDEELKRVVERTTADLHAILGTTKEVAPETAGRAIAEGYKDWAKATRVYIDKLYKQAYEQARDVHLDLSQAQRTAREVQQGTLGRKTVIDYLKGPDGTSIIDANGQPIKVTREEFIQLREKSAELEDILKNIIGLDSVVTEVKGKSPYEQIKDLRTQLFDLKRASIGQKTQIEHDAEKLYTALTNAIESPVGGGADFIKAHEAASGTYRFYKGIAEMTDMVRIGRVLEGKGQPGQLAMDLVRPGNEQVIRTLKWSLPDTAWEKFADGFRTGLRNDPGTIESRLNQFKRDPRIIRMFMSNTEEQALRTYGREWRKLENSGLTQSFRTMADQQERALKILGKTDAEGLASVIDKAGGKGSAFAQALQASLFDDILTKATKLDKGFEMLDAKALIKAVDDLERSGKLAAVMPDSAVQFLKDRRFLSSFLSYQADVGASLQKGEVGSGLMAGFNFFQPAQSLARVHTAAGALSKNAIVGRILANPKARAVLMKLHSAPSASAVGLDESARVTMARAGAAIAMQFAADLTRGTEQ